MRIKNNGKKKTETFNRSIEIFGKDVNFSIVFEDNVFREVITGDATFEPSSRKSWDVMKAIAEEIEIIEKHYNRRPLEDFLELEK